MRFNPKALGLTLGLAWATAVFVAGVAHVLWPGYGGAFLDAVASIYPGYHVGGFGEVMIGALYALLDGAVCGVVVAWLYNTAAKEVPRA